MLMTLSILVIIRHGNNSYLLIRQYQVNKFSKNNLSYLGLNIINDPDKGYISIDQIVYIDNIIEKYGLQYKEFKSRQEQVMTPSSADFFQTDVDV